MAHLSEQLRLNYRPSTKHDHEQHLALFNALAHHLDKDNPECIGILGPQGNEKLFSGLASEVHLIADYLSDQGKSAVDIDDMFRTMIEIWDNTDTGNPTEKFSKTAPVASLSYMARGSKVYCNELLDDVAVEVGLRLKNLPEGEKIVLVDIGAGMGAQGQYISDRLSEAGIRENVEIIGLGPIAEELDIAAYREGKSGRKVFDALIHGACADFANAANRPSHVDIMISNGVMGSFVFEGEFGLMLESGSFTRDTAYMFITRSKNLEGFLEALSQKNMLQRDAPVRVDKVRGYDMVMHDTNGTVLNRDYSLIWANSLAEQKRRSIKPDY